MRKPLVSIITPCYNGEKCLSRLLDSIIAQTWRPIEFILINDGSTDGTLELAETYKNKFLNADIFFQIISQENKGLGGAINSGLKIFTGDYLCWPDADDYLEPSSVEDRVRVLEENPDYAVISSDAYIRECGKLDTYVSKISDGLKYLNDSNQFEHLLNAESIFCSGCHMLRSTMFFDVYPDREIYPARRGQNWQLLLPVYYKYKWMFLDKPLYNYIVFPNSMSKNENKLDSFIYRFEEHEIIIKKTIKHIQKSQGVDLQRYIALVEDKYSKRRMNAAINFRNKEAFRAEYNRKKQNVGIDAWDRFARIRCSIPVINTITNIFKNMLTKHDNI